MDMRTSVLPCHKVRGRDGANPQEVRLIFSAAEALRVLGKTQVKGRPGGQSADTAAKFYDLDSYQELEGSVERARTQRSRLLRLDASAKPGKLTAALRSVS